MLICGLVLLMSTVSYCLPSTITIKIGIVYDAQFADVQLLTEAAINRLESTLPYVIFDRQMFFYNKNDSLEVFVRSINGTGVVHWDLIIDFSVDIPMLTSSLNALNIPVISINFRFIRAHSAAGVMPDFSNIIWIKPPSEIIANVVRDILEKLNRNDALVLYDDTFGIMKNMHHTLLRNLASRHILLRMDTSSDLNLKNQVERLKETDIGNIFLVAQEENIRKILEKIEVELIFGPKIALYAVSKEELDDIELTCKNCKLLTASPKLSYRNFLEEIPETRIDPKSLVDSAFAFDVLVVSLTAIARLKAASGSAKTLDVLLKMKRLNYSGVLGKFVFDETNEFHNYVGIKLEIRKLCKLPDQNQSSAMIGSWTYGKDNKQMSAFIDNLTDFLPITYYRVSSIVKPPFLYKYVMNDGSEKYEGICIDLLEKLKENLKFEYVLEVLPPEKSISEVMEGEWSGVIGQVANRIADIGLAPLYITADRERVVDFTIPFYDIVGMKILMKKTESETSMFKFLTVMEFDVWVSIWAAYLVTSCLLFIIDRYSPFSYQNNREKFAHHPERREFTFTECLWFCITSLTPQGGGEAPKNVSGRLLAATWWLFCFIVVASYTANLAAFLTVSRLDNPIESLDALANQYKIHYAPVNNSPAMHYFRRMADIENKFFEKWKEMTMDEKISEEHRAEFSVYEYPVSDKYTKMWEAIQNTGMPETFEEGIARIRNTSGGFALIGDMTDVRYAAMTSCDLIEVGEEFSRRAMGLAVRKGSLLREQLSIAILELQNKRILENLKERWWTNNRYRMVCDDGNSNVDGISLKNIGGVFIVIIIGMVIAWIVLGFEYLWYCAKQKKIQPETEARNKDISSKQIQFVLTKGLKQKNNYFFKS